MGACYTIKSQDYSGFEVDFQDQTQSSGSIQRHKARFVAKGYSQLHGVDYNKSYFPIAQTKTKGVILALVYQFDVKSSFLNGELKEDVLVDQPERFTVIGNEEKVYKLHKSLVWFKTGTKSLV